MSYRTLGPGQRSQVWIGGPGLPVPELLFETEDILVEAPNWSIDGGSLLVNGNGKLWQLDVDSPEPSLAPVEFQDLPHINNDHVLDPDGRHIYMSAMDGHIYRGALKGGTVERVTHEDGQWHFLHGVSPDGSRLAYVKMRDFSEPGKLAVMEPHGPSHVVETGGGHIDGPEWSPDGRWIYFNTEGFTSEPGHAQLARIPDAGGVPERLVSSNTVDWFPHLSPDAQWASYIAFPAGTIGHPPDLDVEVRLVAVSEWPNLVQRYPLFGGQGTINVNSWSPDSSRFAFVAYPVAGQ
ncbi:TolB family protein [bacterium RCC_150]